MRNFMERPMRMSHETPFGEAEELAEKLKG
jgi:hypothetical protein